MEQPELFDRVETLPKETRRPRPPALSGGDAATAPGEWKVLSLREQPAPESMMKMERASDGVDYWRRHIETGCHFNPDCECAAVLVLNTRLRIRGHYLVSLGALSQTLAEPREVFRLAVMAAAHGVVLMHNHPGGEADPGTADRRLTSLMREAGRIPRIELIDHIITGRSGRYFSFREAGML